MKRMTLLVALLAFTVGSAGCCCCNWLRRAGLPTARRRLPAAAPVCDPCMTAPVSYGAPVPVAPYSPPPQW